MVDIKLSIIIPDAEVEETRTEFLAYAPKPSDFEGTDIEWLREWLIRRFTRACNIGAKRVFNPRGRG